MRYTSVLATSLATATTTALAFPALSGGGNSTTPTPTMLLTRIALAPTATTTTTPLTRGLQSPPDLLHITLVNSHTAPLSTAHASNAGGPAPVSGITTPGTLAVGATAAFAAPTGWAGRVAVGEAEAEAPLGQASLVEAGFMVWEDFGVAVADVDVSYVDAFTVPIVCSCNGVQVSGCNKDLFALNTCPDLRNGVCMNDPVNAKSAAPFFAPCRGSAYTFPTDDIANSYGLCQDGQVTCCVGTACPRGPKQSL